jgi:hypothetical protein
MNALYSMVAVALAVFAATVSEQDTVVPADFQLQFEGGLCTGPAIDTRAGTYRREIDSGRWVTARVPLTSVQRSALFAMVTSAELMSYPEEFDPLSRGRVIPAPRHVIGVQFDAQRRTIRWTDHGSTEPAAMRLRHFIEQVRGYFEGLPEVARLPKQQSFCL